VYTKKQTKTPKNMPPDVKQIILANVNLKLYRCTLTSHKFMQQQMSGKVLVLIVASSAYPFWI